MSSFKYQHRYVNEIMWLWNYYGVFITVWKVSRIRCCHDISIETDFRQWKRWMIHPYKDASSSFFYCLKSATQIVAMLRARIQHPSGWPLIGDAINVIDINTTTCLYWAASIRLWTSTGRLWHVCRATWPNWISIYVDTRYNTCTIPRTQFRPATYFKGLFNQCEPEASFGVVGLSIEF